MPYFAAALARTDAGWVARELDLDELEDLDAVADLLRELGGEDSGGPALMFVEEDDEWFGVVRVDGDADPRVFISDARVIDTSDIAALLAEAAEVQQADESEGNDDEEEETMRPAAEPIGDLELLASLGTSGKELLALCAEEGQLPADIISAICEKAGALEEMDRLRGT